MAQFNYRAYDFNGNAVLDVIDAETEDQAFRKVSAKGLTVVNLELKRREGAAGKVGGFSLFGPRRVKLDELVVVTRELSIMIGAGVPVTEALESIAEHARTDTVRTALDLVHQEIIEGRNFSQALRAAPNVFPGLYCDIVRVAEEGGKLDQALESGAAYLEGALDLKRKVGSAMLYPVVLLVISFLTVLIMVMFVLPRFSKIFSSMGADVPATTQFLLNTSKFLQMRWPFVLIVLAGLFVGAKAALKRPAVQRLAARVVLRTPYLGDIVAKVAVARMLGSLSTMLSGNVPLLNALQHCARIVSNPVIEDGLNVARVHVEQGRSLSESLADVEGLPRLVVQMAQVGEKTGELADVMERTSQFFKQEVDTKLKSLTSVIEPIMIVVLGIVVGFITLSVVTPIYSIVGSVK